jgi:hypothetical protein
MLLLCYILRTFAVAFTPFLVVALFANVLLTVACSVGSCADPFEDHRLEQKQVQKAAGIEHKYVFLNSF